jgi:hypothetical protein
MNKRVLAAITASMSLWMIFACSQKYQGELLPVQDESTGKWGYADTTGKSVIAPQWDMAGVFSEGLAVIGLNGKYGFVDSTGTEVIAPKWDTAGIFSEGLAAIRLNGKYGFVDKMGNEVIPVKYDKVEPFSGGLSPVELDYMNGVIDTAGKTAVPFQAKELKFEGGSCRVIDFAPISIGNKLEGLDIKDGEKTFQLNFTYSLNAGVKENALSVLGVEGKFADPDGKTYKAGVALQLWGMGGENVTYSLIVAVPKDLDVGTLNFVFDNQKIPLKSFIKK